MKPGASKPSRRAPWPSWKTHVSTPYDAPIEIAAITIALSGNTIERNPIVSSTSIAPPRASSIHGSADRKVSTRSTVTAVGPPMSASPVDSGTSRRSRTTCFEESAWAAPTR